MRRVPAAVAVLVTVLFLASVATASPRADGPSGTWYTVAFTSSTLPANVDKLVADAGGTIVVRLPEIGGLGVVSSSPAFVAKMGAVASVAAAAKSARTSLPPVENEVGNQNRQFGAAKRHGGKASGAGTDPQPMPDNLGAEQWDKMRMNVSLAGSYAVDRGRPEVHVALTDTGVDQTHPDIQPNLDLADSTSFVPWETDIQDYNGHGTWTASAVGAPINTIGISGVAPNVTLVALKTNDANGDGLQISIDQALVYAAKKRFDIVSSSIIAYGQTCRGVPADSCDNADYVLAQRAVDYARARGVTIIAALGNDNLDVSDRRALGDVFGVQGGVAEILGSLDGVVGVSATGYFNEKAFYSNYGLGSVDIAAPGGDSIFQAPASGYDGGGRLLGAWSSTASAFPSAYATEDCVGSVCGLYAWSQGTSMAAPNAAGVAALIVSRYGDFGRGQSQRGNNGDNGRGNDDDNGRTHLRPESVERILLGTAAAQSCPTPRTVTYDLGFPFDSATCQGGSRFNGFYGAGIVNALAALTQRR